MKKDVSKQLKIEAEGWSKVADELDIILQRIRRGASVFKNLSEKIEKEKEEFVPSNFGIEPGFIISINSAKTTFAVEGTYFSFGELEEILPKFLDWLHSLKMRVPARLYCEECGIIKYYNMQTDYPCPKCGNQMI